MKKQKRSALMILGLGLIFLSLSLLLVFQVRLRLGARYSQRILSQIQQILPERTRGVPGAYPYGAMPVLAMDGADYVAVMEVPAFGITLPVADQWDGGKLYRSPARFCGSVYDHSLIIGGQDHARQFAFCGQIQHGATITVTDMTGARFTYTVSRIDRAKHAETQWLLSEGSDLTIFCHDAYAMEYIAVRCVASYK